MRIDQISIALRPRTAWEAVDLGLALTRKHALAIWKPWLLVSLPVFAAVNAVCYALGHLWAAVFVMWWLKPLFDRIPIYVLSRAVFGSEPSWQQTLSGQLHWQWGATFRRLLWLRLDPWRCIGLPVDLLEGLPAAQRPARRAVLRNAISGQSGGLTLVCSNFEIVLYLSIYGVVLMFLPVEYVEDNFSDLTKMVFEQPAITTQILSNLIIWMVTSTIEPFYIGAGFGMYLNRRMHLEAWDIELGFRQLASRLAAHSRLLAATLVIACAMTFGLFNARPAAASPPSPTDIVKEIHKEEAKDRPIIPIENVIDDRNSAQIQRFGEAVKKTFEDPLLGEKKIITEWRHIDRNKPSDLNSSSWIPNISAAFALIGEIMLWVIAIALVIWLLLRYDRWLSWLSDKLPGRAASPIQTSQAPPPESLPDDICAAALALWQQQRHRDALAMLYRGAGHEVSQRLPQPLPPGTTEGGLLRHTRQLPETSISDLVTRLVTIWRRAAYADQLPSESEVIAVCNEWPKVFTTRSAP